ncbi:MAG: hypothetical protein AAF843_04525 [Bacteroidota bacterium]
MQIIGILLIAFLLPFPMFSQRYTQEQVKEDLEYLIKQIEIYNPALEPYNPNFKREADRIVNSIEGGFSTFELFQRISEIATLSNEGHFGLGTWEDEAHKGLIDGKLKYMPLAPHVLDGRIYVWDDLTNGDTFMRFSKLSFFLLKA